MAELVRCVYEYQSHDARELDLRVGDVVEITVRHRGMHWAEGRCRGRIGVFPLSHCVASSSLSASDVDVIVVEDVPQRIVCTASFRAVEPGELPLRKGDVPTLIRRPTSEMWYGEHNGISGIFPASHVAPVLEGNTPREPPKIPAVPHVRYLPTVLIFVLLLGMGTAVISWAMDVAIVSLFRVRLLVLQMPYFGAQYIVWIACMLALASLSFVFTRLVSPLAVGSGVAEVTSVISGVELPGFLSLRTFVAKVIGLIFSVGSGLFVWKQGPNVHISACIGNLLLQLRPFKIFREAKGFTRQLLPVAAGFGLSAQFAAPIGGVLFSIETTATYYPARNYWLVAVATITASSLVRILHNMLDSRVGYSIRRSPVVPLGALFAGVLPTSEQITIGWSMTDIASGLLLGIISAVLAIAFLALCRLVSALKLRFATRMPRTRVELLYLLTVTLVTAVLTFPRLLGDYLAVPEMHLLADLFSPSLQDTALINIVDWSRRSVPASLAILFAVRFLLTSFSPTLPIPLGIFEPCFLLGAVSGRFFGELLWSAGSPISAPLCALMGAAAFAASTSNTISSALIALELVGDLQSLIPVLIATSTSLLIVRFAAVPSLWHQMNADKGIPYLAPNVRYATQDDQAREAMQPVLFLPRTATFDQIEAVQRCDAIVVPVVYSMEEPYLLGEIDASALPQVEPCEGSLAESRSALRAKAVR